MHGSRPLRLGTRGSPLALIQAQTVRDHLAAYRPELSQAGAITVTPIRSSGDVIQDRALRDAGGKGLFIKELEEALLADQIDIAVHSLKDMPTTSPDGLVIAGVLPRADARDVFICAAATHPRHLPQQAIVGTASLRRQAQLLAMRPDLQITLLRGNVDTRLRKIEDGAAAATILARAGLARLGLEARGTLLSTADMLPAPGQGVLAIQARRADESLCAMLTTLSCPATLQSVTCERALLATLDGSCHTPIGAYAELQDGQIHLDALIALPDGSRIARRQQKAGLGDASALGHTLGAELRRLMPASLFAA